MPARKICVVTGTRAEYGLLYWLMKEIESDPALELKVIATGAHLSPEFGLTYRVIEEDGFTIDEKVEMLLSSDTRTGAAKSAGLGVIGFAGALDRIKPDMLVVLGDRYEVLSAVSAATLLSLPVAHIHGGESTEGAVDEQIRHAVTKMSHLHFAAADAYAARIIQMGEDPERVFNFGAPGLDNIKRLKLLKRTELEDAIGFKLGSRSLLVTYHPETLNKDGQERSMREFLAALDEFPDVNVIMTGSNADAGARAFSAMADDYATANPKRVKFFSSLGQLRYLSAMSHVDALAGNSSSGIIEAPALKKPSVNVGDRQKGRLRATSVIDCATGTEAIVAAVKRALSPEFKRSLEKVTSLYGDADASRRIKDCLRDVSLVGILMKSFYDAPGAKR